MSRAWVWYGRAVLLGAAANGLTALALLAAPALTLEALGLGPAEPWIWARLSGLLLLFYSILLIPFGRDAERHNAQGWLLVAFRVAGATLFILHGSAFARLCAFDLFFALVQGLLLTIAIRASGISGASHP